MWLRIVGGRSAVGVPQAGGGGSVGEIGAAEGGKTSTGAPAEARRFGQRRARERMGGSAMGGAGPCRAHGWLVSY
jgi:hypothetical protein